MKQRIAAIEKVLGPKEKESEGGGLDALERQQAAIEKSLEVAGQKLATARLLVKAWNAVSSLNAWR